MCRVVPREAREPFPIFGVTKLGIDAGIAKAETLPEPPDREHIVEQRGEIVRPCRGGVHEGGESIEMCFLQDSHHRE